jgi:NitT/TauT family transport system substrate-binding protein
MPFEDNFSRRDLMKLSALLTAGGALPLLRTY